MAAIVALAAAACGGDDDDGGATGDDVDRNGTLRVAFNLTAISGAEVDPAVTRNLQDSWHMSLIYGTLLKPGESQGVWEPNLAESYEIVDPQTINVELRSGLTFQDGTPFTAGDVRTSTLRNRDAKNGNLSPDLAQLTDVQVVSPTEMNFKLATPIAGSFVELLAGRETMTASPTTTDQASAPVGAGPYKLQSYSRSVEMVLERWDDYVDADDYRIKTIRLVQADPGAPAVNALRADQVDTASMDAATSEGVRGQPDITLERVVSDGSFMYIGMCKDGTFPYWNDPRFRKAVNFAIDREAINDAVLLGQGQPTAGLWPEGSRYYDESLEEFLERDVDRAKQLLREVGVPDGYQVEMSVSQGVSNIQQFAEVVQAQLADVGIKVTLRPTTDIVRDFFRGKQTPFTTTLWIRPGLQKLTRQFTAGQAANVCNYTNPTLSGYMSELAKLDPSDPEAKDVWLDAQQFIVADNMLAVYVAFQPQLWAFRTDNIGGEYRLVSASGFTPYPDVTSIYVKQ